MTRTAPRRKRFWFQTGFFALFVTAPILDLFRISGISPATTGNRARQRIGGTRYAHPAQLSDP